MAVVTWRPSVVLGPVAMAFPPSVAKAAGVARLAAPIRTGNLRRSVRPIVGMGLAGAIFARASYAAAQEYGAKPHTIGEPGKILASKAPPASRGATIAGKRSTRQNFFAFGPVHHPGHKGKRFMDKGAKAWKALYVSELRKRLGR